MLKSLSFLFSFFLGKVFERFDEKKPFSEIITDQMLLILRKLLKVSLSAVAIASLAVGGTLLLLVELVKQVESDSPFSYAPGFWIYLGFTLATYVGLAFLLQKKRWELELWKHDLKDRRTVEGQDRARASAGGGFGGGSHDPSPIETAISALILDFVQERQNKRSDLEKKSEAMGPVTGNPPPTVRAEMRTESGNSSGPGHWAPQTNSLKS